MSYYEQKKRDGLIFTMHNIDNAFGYDATLTIDGHTELIDQPDGPLYWSKLSGRYRTCEEQRAFIENNCIDSKLPPLHT